MENLDFLNVTDDEEDIKKEQDKKNKNDRSRNNSLLSHKEHSHHHHKHKHKHKHKHHHHHYYNKSETNENKQNIKNINKDNNLNTNSLKTEQNNINNNESKWSENENIKSENRKINISEYLKENLIIKEKPNFNPSGLLSKQTNTKNGVLIKYSTPLDSTIPPDGWRLYSFKKNSFDPIDTYKLEKKHFFLIGKDKTVCNIIIDNVNVSRQHAVIQFRKIINNKKEEIKPYLIDLESKNGTYLNGVKLEESKYYELMKKDIINFGDFNIEYILM